MYTVLEKCADKEIFLFEKIRDRKHFLLLHCKRSVKMIQENR